MQIICKSTIKKYIIKTVCYSTVYHLFLSEIYVNVNINFKFNNFLQIVASIIGESHILR